MNPRQRRGVLLLLLSGLGALVLFGVVTSYVSGVNAQVAPLVTVYAARDAIPAYTQLSEQDVEAVEVPERWVPDTGVRDVADLVGRRVAYSMQPGTWVGTDALLPPSAIRDDEREIAIQVDAVTGLAGRVEPGDLVDVYAVFGDAEDGVSRTLVRNVRVVSVGGQQTRREPDQQGALAEQSVVPVTLALAPQEALSVTYADAFAVSVRLVGLPPGIEQQDRRGEFNRVDNERLGIPRTVRQ